MTRERLIVFRLSRKLASLSVARVDKTALDRKKRINASKHLAKNASISSTLILVACWRRCGLRC